MAAAKKKATKATKSFKCHLCKKTVTGTSIKHLWEKHRKYMMVNRHRGPRKPKVEGAASAKTPKGKNGKAAGGVNAVLSPTGQRRDNAVLAFILLETLSAKFGKKSPEAAINDIYEQLAPLS